MPSALSYPGVYIEEVSSGVHAIVGVSTSIGAFIGRTAKGPIDRAERVTDLATFGRKFGGAHPDSDLADSVSQFFLNGGTDCYVVRVAHQAAQATLTLQTIRPKPVLKGAAHGKGELGNTLRLEVDYATSSPDDTFNLRVLADDGRSQTTLEEFPNLSMNPDAARFAPDFVTESSTQIIVTKEIADLKAETPVATDPAYSEGRRPLVGNTNAVAGVLNAILAPAAPAAPATRFEISVDDGPYLPVNLAGALAGDADAVLGLIQDRLDAQIPASSKVTASWGTITPTNRLLRITSATTARSSVRIRPSGFEDLAGPLMLGVAQGGVEVGRYQRLRPVPTATLFAADLNKLNDLAKLQQNAFDTITIDAEPSISLVVGGTSILQTTAAGEAWWKEKVGATPSLTGNSDGVREKLGLLVAALNASPPPATGIRTFRAELWGYHLALIATSGISSRAINVVSAANAAFGAAFTPNARRYALGTAPGSTFISAADIGTNGATARHQRLHRRPPTAPGCTPSTPSSGQPHGVPERSPRRTGTSSRGRVGTTVPSAARCFCSTRRRHGRTRPPVARRPRRTTSIPSGTASSVGTPLCTTRGFAISAAAGRGGSGRVAPSPASWPGPTSNEGSGRPPQASKRPLAGSATSRRILAIASRGS
jgi:hypothetical protein